MMVTQKMEMDVMRIVKLKNTMFARDSQVTVQELYTLKLNL